MKRTVFLPVLLPVSPTFCAKERARDEKRALEELIERLRSVLDNGDILPFDNGVLGQYSRVVELNCSARETDRRVRSMRGLVWVSEPDGMK